MYIFQYSYITYSSRVVSYYFDNKRIDVLDTCCIRYTYRIYASQSNINTWHCNATWH